MERGKAVSFAGKWTENEKAAFTQLVDGGGCCNILKGPVLEVERTREKAELEIVYN